MKLLSLYLSQSTGLLLLVGMELPDGVRLLSVYLSPNDVHTLNNRQQSSNELSTWLSSWTTDNPLPGQLPCEPPTSSANKPVECCPSVLPINTRSADFLQVADESRRGMDSRQSAPVCSTPNMIASAEHNTLRECREKLESVFQCDFNASSVAPRSKSPCDDVPLNDTLVTTLGDALSSLSESVTLRSDMLVSQDDMLTMHNNTPTSDGYVLASHIDASCCNMLLRDDMLTSHNNMSSYNDRLMLHDTLMSCNDMPASYNDTLTSHNGMPTIHNNTPASYTLSDLATSQTVSLTRDETRDADEHARDLIKMELYVQGNSDTVFVLVLNEGTCEDVNLIGALVG